MIVMMLLAATLLSFVLMIRPANYAAKQKIAHTFLLTDYCFSTESRHTRHIALPENIAPFQDFPAYHDHFPSSSFIQPIRLNQQYEYKINFVGRK
jgi:hypothetical protein